MFVNPPQGVNVLFKTIPGYGIYRISEYGDIECYIDGSVQFSVEQIESKTSKGTYKVVTIYNNKLHKKWRGVHQLVCLTFNGEPPNDGNIYDVNHKDGNKHNNHYSNLEWMLHKENSLHALKSGLRYDNIPIVVENILTGKTLTYYSIIELSRCMNIARDCVYALLGRFNKKPFKDTYIFKLDIRNFGLVNRKFSQPLRVYDYVEEKWLFCKSVNMCSALTGIKSGMLRYLLSNNNNIHLAGYYIGKEDIPPHIINVDYKPNEANKDRENYFNSDPIVDDPNFRNIVLNEHV